ncbi:MAG: SpoIID/LytB domain-containing protein [bacterium]
MRIFSRVFLLGLLVLLLISRPSIPQENSSCPVFVLYSRATASFSPTSWLADFRTVLSTLSAMGVHFRLLNEEELAVETLDCSLLILPDLRCLKPETSGRVAQFARSGGRVMALYQASYRDDKNMKVGSNNNFQMAGLFGCDFYRWVSGRPACDSLVLSEGFLAFEPGADRNHTIYLGRNRGMLVRLRSGAVPLAFWKEEKTPAIVLNPQRNCIYVGENLFAPENSASSEVRLLMAKLLNILVPGLLDPAAAAVKTPELSTSPPVLNSVSIPPGGETLRILLAGGLSETGVETAEGLSRVRLSSQGTNQLEILDESGQLSRRAAKRITFEATPGGAVRIIFFRPNGTYSAQAVRGAVEITASGGSLSAVNILSLEEYLAGVLPNEMLYTFPPESLKAMAMIARTFALSHRGRHGRENYNLCTSVHCQVYGGAYSEELSTSRAILETRGKVVCFRGRLAEVTYHSCCGGAGEAVENAWGGDSSPYLRTYSDAVGSVERGGNFGRTLTREKDFRKFMDQPPACFCENSGRFRWREEYTGSELEALFRESLPVVLNNPGINPGRINSVRVLNRFPSGRVRTLLIEGSGGTFRIGNDSIRWLFSAGKLGLGGLQSTLFYIDNRPDNGDTRYIFHGGGWGHGVGLCQEGAAGMARRGLTATKIIRHYFPGTEIVQK